MISPASKVGKKYKERIKRDERSIDTMKEKNPELKGTYSHNENVIADEAIDLC